MATRLLSLSRNHSLAAAAARLPPLRASATPGALVPHARSVNVFAEFAKSVRRQVQENKDLQKNIKQLSDETTRLGESDAVARARQAMSKTSETTSRVMNAVGNVVDKTLETPVVKKTGEAIVKTAEVVANVSQKVVEPIQKTTAGKAITSGIKEVIDSSSNAFYAEYMPKEVREKERMERLERQRRLNPLGPDPSKPMLPNPEAGFGIVVHRASKVSEAWRAFKENSIIGQSISAAQRRIEQSNNPILERLRDFFSRANVEESQQAKVVRAFRQIDPSFSLDAFLKEATRYMVPEIMEAYLRADAKILQDWCSEAAFAKLTMDFESQRKQGLVSDSKLLDIRNVDIRQVSMLNDEFPIVLIGFVTQEILLFRNLKGKLVVGREDEIQTASYVIAMTRAQLLDPEADIKETTGGWVVVDWARAKSGW